ncbi:hypothetical protein O181_054724 [Austropuccinia psidii MF-1]|uniref:Uncharacterized protein n=1 Tax=Austropuccinia psidii MF-1 TaxID=1389203 RepID=A0A9Q3E539_9BASI|nr:hypothetical protein [Austropuccinia psidii MF-1]
MTNLTPNSQLSSYERLNHLLSGNQEEHEDIHSVQNIKYSCDATGGGGLYIQLQWHHVIMEVFDLLKEINQKNYSTNEVGFDSGDFPPPLNNNNGEKIHEDFEVPMEPSGNQVAHLGSENGGSGPREGMGNWPDDPENIPSQPKGRHTTQHICGTSRMVCVNSSSQMSSVSRGTTLCNWNFINNMDTNMQNILLPLMLMLHKSQDQAEERD